MGVLNGKIMGKSWENLGTSTGKSGKIMGKPTRNEGIRGGKGWENNLGEYAMNAEALAGKVIERNGRFSSR